MGCPECEPGDVEVRGAGDASCTLCGGGFVALDDVVRALRINVASLEAKPASGPATCPICSSLFRPCRCGGVAFHACLFCRAVWAAPGALARAAPSPRAAPTPAPPTPAPAPRARPEPSAPTRARPVASSAPRRAPVVDEQLAAVRQASERRLPWRALVVVVLVCCAAPVAWTMRPLPSASIGGRALAVPWRDKPVRELVDAGDGARGERLRFEHGALRLEAIYFDRAPAPATLERLAGVAVPDGRHGSGVMAGGRVGAVEVVQSGAALWMLTASAADDGSFATSDAARAFLTSLR